jgi:glutathione S-transferase
MTKSPEHLDHQHRHNTSTSRLNAISQHLNQRETMSPPELTLYRKDGACSMAVHILLLHLDIPFTPCRITFGKDGSEAADGSFTAEEYRQMVPNGFVPALRVSGEEKVLTELLAIMFYIANLRPEGKSLLGGSSLFEHSRVLQWMAWLSGTLHAQGFGAFWRPRRFVGEKEELYDTVKAQGLKKIEECYSLIDQRLDGPEHAVGKELTVVDIFLHTFWRWGKLIGVKMDERYPRYREVAMKAEELGSVKTAMRTERVALCFE